MDGQERVASDDTLMEYLQHRLSRAQLFKAGAFAGVIAGVPGLAVAQTTVSGGTGAPQSFPFFPQVPGTYTTEGVTDILNTLVTISEFAATAFTVIIGNAAGFGVSGLALSVAQAGAAQEQAHIDFLSSIGAVPLTSTFTLPTSLTGLALLAASETSAGIQAALYVTAVREFAELGQPTLAKWAAQAGETEAEQRVLFRMLQALAGVSSAIPPNNKGFETDLFLYVRDAIGIYTALGFIGGIGTAFTYPGRAAVLAAAGPMATALVQRTPNNASSTVVLTGPTSLTGERP